MKLGTLYYVIVLYNSGLKFNTCPPTETAIVPPNSNKASVTWVPPVIDGGGANIATSHDHYPGEFFPIGNTTVTYTALNFTSTSVLDRAECEFVVRVLGVYYFVYVYMYIKFNIIPHLQPRITSSTTKHAILTLLASSSTDDFCTSVITFSLKCTF